MNSKAQLILGDLSRYIATTLAGILLSRTFSKPDFGTYLQGVLLVSTFSLIGSIGLPKAVYFFTSSELKPRNILYHIFIALAVSIAFWTGSLFLCWGTLAKVFSNPALNDFSLIILANVAIRTANSMFAPVLVVLNRVRLIFIIWTLVSTLLLLLFFIIGKMDTSVYWLFWANLFLELFEFITLCVIAFKFIPGKWQGLDIKLLFSLGKYCLPIFISVILIVLSKKVDGFLISSYFDPSQFAIYSRGALEIPLKQLVIYNLASLLMPQIVRLYNQGDLSGITLALDQEIRKIVTFLFPVFFLFAIVHVEIIVFLYSPEYLASARIFLIYLFFIPVQFYAYDSILQSVNRNAILTFVSVTTILVNLGSSFLLFPILGSMAPAVGTLLGLTVNSVLCLYFIHKFLKNPFAKWLPWHFLFRLTVYSALPGIALWLLKGYLSLPPILNILFVSSSYTIVTFFIFWKVGVFSEPDKEAIKLQIKKLLPKIFISR